MATMIAEKPATITKTKPPGNPDFWVKVGQSFEIKLIENPTTGYNWALAQLPENFYLLSELYVPDPNKLGMVGSGGTRHFYFVAMKPTTEMGNFIFYLLRPWEPMTPIEESDWSVGVR
jgi:predicted secreted protein